MALKFALLVILVVLVFLILDFALTGITKKQFKKRKIKEINKKSDKLENK